MTGSQHQELSFTGRAWVFGDGINTDDMYPGFAMKLPMEDAARNMFNATRPDWPSLVQPGDIVIGGRSFGIGSSRPVPLLFKSLGVSCLIAEQFNSLFYRNCINYGLPVLTVPGISGAITEGDSVSVDFDKGQLIDVASGSEYQGTRPPAMLRSILQAGGLFAQLEATGYLRPAQPKEELSK